MCIYIYIHDTHMYIYIFIILLGFDNKATFTTCGTPKLVGLTQDA